MARFVRWNRHLQMTIQLTLHELIALLDGDDTLSDERGWLLRNTLAAAECTVVRAHVAASVRAMDPDGAIIHIQTYAVPESGLQIHTAWTPITWRESIERRRLHQLNHSQWREEQHRRERCLNAAADFARKIAETFGLSPRDYAAKFTSAAEQLAFDETKFTQYLSEIDKQFNITISYEQYQSAKRNPRPPESTPKDQS